MKQDASPSEQVDIKEHISLRDADSFKHLYNKNHLAVFRFIFGIHGGPTEEIEDLTAETFIRAWKSRTKFKGSEQAALGWLLKIARNLVIDNYRRNKTRGFPVDIETHFIHDDEPNPEELLNINEQVKTLWSLLLALPDQQREILVLRYLLGWRVTDISRHLEMKENTVSVYIRRAIHRLRQNWPTERD